MSDTVVQTLGFPLTQDQLDDIDCPTVKCPHNDCVLIIRTNCHPNAPIFLKYRKRKGTLELVCAECGKTAAFIQVAE